MGDYFEAGGYQVGSVHDQQAVGQGIASRLCDRLDLRPSPKVSVLTAHNSLFARRDAHLLAVGSFLHKPQSLPEIAGTMAPPPEGRALAAR